MGERRNANRHLIILASYAETPIGVSKWLVTNDIYIFPCCYARDILKHVANLKAGFSYLYHFPAISKHLSAFLHSWLLSSDAYGIF